jgi:hypothetical protein
VETQRLLPSYDACDRGRAEKKRRLRPFIRHFFAVESGPHSEVFPLSASPIAFAIVLAPGVVFALFPFPTVGMDSQFEL